MKHAVNWLFAGLFLSQCTSVPSDVTTAPAQMLRIETGSTVPKVQPSVPSGWDSALIQVAQSCETGEMGSLPAFGFVTKTNAVGQEFYQLQRGADLINVNLLTDTLCQITLIQENMNVGDVLSLLNSAGQGTATLVEGSQLGAAAAFHYIRN